LCNHKFCLNVSTNIIKILVIRCCRP